MVRTAFIVVLGLNVLAYLWFAFRGGVRITYTRGSCVWLAFVYSVECIALAHYWPEG